MDDWDACSDDEYDDDGMSDPLVLRGLLQCLAIGLMFTIRYVLDVLFTPCVVQAVLRQMFHDHELCKTIGAHGDQRA